MLRHLFPLRGMGKGVERVVGTEKGREGEQRSREVEMAVSMWREKGEENGERGGKGQGDRVRAGRQEQEREEGGKQPLLQ